MASEKGAGRVVVVTGGNRGIGRAIADRFAASGDRIVSLDRLEQVEGLSCLPCDVTNPEDVDRAIGKVEEELGAIDVLVANAGIADDKLVLQMDEGSFDRVLDINLVGAFRVIKRALPKMLRARKGRIIVTSSVVAFSGAPGQVNYAASKAGLVGLARSLAREVGSRNITVNAIAPGFVETPMTASLSEARRAEVMANIPLKRFAQPDEVAGVVHWLASDQAGYVTGAVIPVDGGLGMGH